MAKLKSRNDLERTLMDRFDYAHHLDLVDDDWYHRAIIRMSRYSDADLVQALIVAERAVWNHAQGYSSNRALKRALNYNGGFLPSDPLDELSTKADDQLVKWALEEDHETIPDPEDFTWDQF